VTHAGTISVTLTTLNPSTAPIGLGLGTPGSNNACTLTTSTSDATAATTPQFTVTASPGAFCVKAYDSGNLTTATAFAIDIIHS